MISQLVDTVKGIVSALHKEAAIVLALLTELGVAPAAGHNANAQTIILATYAAIVHALDSASTASIAKTTGIVVTAPAVIKTPPQVATPSSVL